MNTGTDGNGTGMGEANADEEELYPEIEELKPEFLRLMRESAEIKGSDMGAAERRVAAE